MYDLRSVEYQLWQLQGDSGLPALVGVYEGASGPSTAGTHSSSGNQHHHNSSNSVHQSVAPAVHNYLDSEAPAARVAQAVAVLADAVQVSVFVCVVTYAQSGMSFVLISTL